jgi:acyl-homoserine-lactone acylase
MKQLFLLFAALQAFVAFAGNKGDDFYMPDYIHPERIQIVRDSFGVPHIFAPTDAEVAYGLAWTTLEDDSETAMFLMYASKMLLGRHIGIDGAAIDYAVQLTRVREVAKDYLDNTCPEDFKRVLEGYCAGANAYLKNHPKELAIKKAFPLEPVDVVAGYMLGMGLMAGVDDAMRSIVEGTLQEKIPALPESPVIGSNAIAIGPSKTADGNTYLDINSHQPLEGLLSWYEAHLCSEEGWNITGSLFHGGISIFHGTNEHLGWAHTVGEFDKKDVFILKMKEDSKEDLYQYGKEWKPLEQSYAKLKVGLGKQNRLILPVRKKIWWSEFGPTIKTKSGVFALRMASLMEPRVAEQWWRMNKTKNFEEFKEVLNMQGVAQMNVCYADMEGNIYLLANGLIPKRKEGLDWENPVWGTDPSVNWQEYYSVDELAQFENPKSGYVFNVNNSAFHGTAYEENLDPKSFPEYMGYDELVNNRSARFYELMEEYPNKISWQDFIDIKFDHQFPKDTFYFLRDFSIMDMYRIDLEKNPDLTDALEHFKNFDGTSDSLDRNFGVILFAMYEIYDRSADRVDELADSLEARLALFTDCVRLAKNHMIKHFGTMDVPLKDLHVLERGGKTVPVNGGPDNIRAAFAKKNGGWQIKNLDWRFIYSVGEIYERRS